VLEENPSSEFGSRWPTWKFFAYYEIGRPIVMFTRTRVCSCSETIKVLSPPSELSNQNTVCVSYSWYVRAVRISFLGSFVILRKAIISFVVSACLSVRPHGTNRLPLDGFLLNLIFEHLSQICRENSCLIKIWQNGYFMYICVTSRWFRRRMINVSDKSCIEYQNTRFIFNNFSRKTCRL
jgi:hypothetical protein